MPAEGAWGLAECTASLLRGQELSCFAGAENKSVTFYLSATLSPELADHTVYVIEVAEGEKISRKGRLGITKSDFL